MLWDGGQGRCGQRKAKTTLKVVNKTLNYFKGFIRMHGMKANLQLTIRDTSTCYCCLAAPKVFCWQGEGC